LNTSIELNHFDTHKLLNAANGAMPVLSYLKAKQTINTSDTD